jgi:hypothetical protein
MGTRVLGHMRANAVGYVALFVALGGSAAAAFRLPDSSVGTRQLRNGAVTGTKVARQTLTGANIRLPTLGTVPNAARLDGESATAFQSRVSAMCASGYAISQIASDGGIACQPTGGTVTGVSAGTGLSGGGSSGDVNLSVADDGINTGQLADGAVTNGKLANPSFTLTPGTGLTGGGSTPLGGATSLSVDPSAVQSRVTGACTGENAIASINQDGTVDCQPTSATNVQMGASGTDLVPSDFLPPDGIGQSANEADVDGTLPVAANLGALYVTVTAAPGGSSAWLFALTDNGQSTGLDCFVQGSSTTCNAAAQVPVSAGDHLALHVTSVGSPAAAQASYGWTLRT